MTEKEYKMQVALGTIDYKIAARETKSSAVLARIVDDCQDPDAHLLVALNPKTDVRTLTRLAIDPKYADDPIVDACICHPAVDLKTLTMWGQRDHISSAPSYTPRLYALQVQENVPQDQRVRPSVKYTQFPNVTWTGKPAVYGKPNTSGDWVTITSSASASYPYFSGSNPSKDKYIYYDLNSGDILDKYDCISQMVSSGTPMKYGDDDENN